MQAQTWRRWAGHQVASAYEPHPRPRVRARSATPRRCIDVSPLYKYLVRGPRRRAPARPHGHARRHQVRRRPGAVHPVVRRARQGHRRRHDRRLDEHDASASPPPSRTCAGCTMNAVGLDVAIEDVSDSHRRARAPGPAVARDPRAASPRGPRGAQVLPPRRTPRSAASRSRSRAPATPATSATRSGSTPARALPRLGRAHRGGHAVRHHARPASGRSTSRASRPGSSCSTSTTSPRTTRSSRPEVVAVRARPRLDGERSTRTASSAAARCAPRRRAGRRGASSASRCDWESLERSTPSVGLPPQLPTVAWRASVPVYRGGEQVGYATSGTWSPLLKKYIALAHVHGAALSRRARAVEIELTVEHRRKRAARRSRKLPFFDPDAAKARLTQHDRRYDAIVIGGGHNGLVDAAYLARAGTQGARARAPPRWSAARRSPRRSSRASSSRCSPTSSACSAPRSSATSICRATACRSCRSRARSRRCDNGDYLAQLGRSRRERAASSCRHSPRDADAYDEFGRLMHHMAQAVKPILGDDAARPDVARAVATSTACCKLGRHMRGARRRAVPRAVQADDDERARLPRRVVRDRRAQGDQVGERHHRHVPRAALAGHGVRAAASLHGRDRRRVPRVGLRRRAAPARSAKAIASAARALRRRDPHRRRRGARAACRAAARPASCSRTATRSPRRSSSRGSTRGAPSSSCVEPKELPDDFVEDIQRFRFRGSSGKVNLALERAAGLHLPARAVGPHLRGAISISPSIDYLERAYDDAKYGEFSRRPVHGHRDPVDDRSRHGAARAST